MGEGSDVAFDHVPAACPMSDAGAARGRRRVAVTPMRARGRGLVSALALALTIAPVLAATLWPFDFDLRPDSVREKWAHFEWVFFYDRAGTIIVDRDLLLNLLLFVPLGVAIAVVRRAPSVWRVTVEAGAAGVALSTGIELLQVLTPERVSQLADIWRNTLGCLVAAFATALISRLATKPRACSDPVRPA